MSESELENAPQDSEGSPPSTSNITSEFTFVYLWIVKFTLVGSDDRVPIADIFDIDIEMSDSVQEIKRSEVQTGEPGSYISQLHYLTIGLL